MASAVPMRALRASLTPLGRGCTTSAASTVGVARWTVASVRYASSVPSSSSSSASSSRPAAVTVPAATTTTTNTTITTTTPTPAPTLALHSANPPATTRPPPLHLPVRSSDTSTMSHLMATGKAYLAFYKTGLRYLYTNWKLVRALSATATATRSNLLLRHRWSHDVRRLPLFAVLLIVCGEMTPLVVIAFPHIVPGPCRIPKQVDKLQRLAEQRRHAAFVDLDARRHAHAHADSVSLSGLQAIHIARSLGLVSSLWDRIGWLPPHHASSAAARRLRFLADDDELLRQSGGVPALEPAEVSLACIDRGIDVRGVPDDSLREHLAAWLELTTTTTTTTTITTSTSNSDPATQRRIALLTTRPDQWPSK